MPYRDVEENRQCRFRNYHSPVLRRSYMVRIQRRAHFYRTRLPVSVVVEVPLMGRLYLDTARRHLAGHSGLTPAYADCAIKR